MERVEPRTLLRLARATALLSLAMVAGNIATRYGLPAGRPRALYDGFLAWNLPGHILICVMFGSVLFTSGELDRVRGRLYAGIFAGAWTVVVGTWLVGGPAATLNLAFATIIVGLSRIVLGVRFGLFTMASVITLDISFAVLRTLNVLPNQSPLPDYVLDHGSRAMVLVAWRAAALVAVFLTSGYIASRKAAYEERLRALEVGTESTVLASEQPSVPDAEPTPGSRIGRYEVLGVIGAGGMGVVVRANDPELGREVAIKLVRTRTSSVDARARLLREARALARLRHPAVVPIYDVGTMGNQVFVVMPFLSGGTLGDWLRKEPRPWRDVVERFLVAARGLSAAHASGLVHRDFKPDNVLIGDDGAVMIADFGLARPGGEESPQSPVSPTAPLADITRTGEIVGTPAYMAPEQLTGGEVDARTDVFAFSLALWEGIFGARPFDANTAIELLAKIHAGPVAPSGSDVPPALIDALRRSLAYSSGERAPSIDALVAELQRTISVPMP